MMVAPFCVHESVRFKFDVLSDGEYEVHRPVYRCEKCDLEFVPIWRLDKAPETQAARPWDTALLSDEDYDRACGVDESSTDSS